MSRTLPRARGVGEALVWYTIPAIALAAVLGYLVLAAVWHANPPVVPVTGRSMRPTIHAGDVVFVKGVVPGELKKGDIIAFHTTTAAQKKYGVPSTYVHRIWLVQKTSSGYQYRTKGDAVSGPDPFWTPDNAVVGKYAFKVTGIGYPILFFRSRQGMIFVLAAIGIGLAYVLMGVFDRRREEADRNALSLAAMVDEARALRDAMAGTPPEARGPPVPDEGTVEVEAPPAGPSDNLLQAPTAEPEPVVLEPRYVPVWEREQEPHLAEFELAPAYREEEQEPPVPPEPSPPARTVDAYLAGELDFDRLEREIHAAVRSTADVKETMRELVGAIGEYGEHLQSHTAVMRSLAAATGDLQATTSELREFLASLTTLLRSLLEQQHRPPS